jgi:hypothetical protein
MNAQVDTDPGVLGLFKTPGTRTYLIVGFAALFVYFMLMTGRGSEIGTVITLLIAVPGLLARWSASPVLVVLLTTYQLIDPNFWGLLSVLDVSGTYYRGSATYSQFVGRGWVGSQYLLEDVLLAGAMLAYLAAQYRLLSLATRSMPDEPRPGQRPDDDIVPVRRPDAMVTDSELQTLLIVGIGCVAFGLVGWVGLRAVESGLSVSSSLIIDKVLGRFLTFMWIFGLGAMLAGAVLGHLALTRMRTDEARLILQDAFWQESRREQERIHHWINWFRRRRPK